MQSWHKRNEYYVLEEESMATDLKPGNYFISTNNFGQLVLKEVEMKADGIITFDAHPYTTFTEEIRTFFSSKEHYDKLRVTHKRGIILYGPPGCGKSVLLVSATKAVSALGGIVFHLRHSNFADFGSCLRKFKQYDKRPVMVVMEDLDTLIEESWDETCALELFDGSSILEGSTLFLATTNNLQDIPKRISYRPSRFDTLFEMPYPHEEVRRTYIQSLVSGTETSDEVMENMIRESRGLSIAMLKELVIGHLVYRRPLVEIAERLRATITEE